MKKETINKIVQIIITILTAISSTILVQSCGTEKVRVSPMQKRKKYYA